MASAGPAAHGVLCVLRNSRPIKSPCGSSQLRVQRCKAFLKNRYTGTRESLIMRAYRGHLLAVGTVCAVAGLMLSPAIGAAGSGSFIRSAESPVSLHALGSISSFTPTIKDTRLAAAYAKMAASSSGRGFRFTPTSGSLSGERSVTVMVRANNNGAPIVSSIAPVNIAPVAFSLNSDRGWRRFALPESVGRKALDPVPVETMVDARNFSLEQGRKDRFSTKLLIENRREPAMGVRQGDKDYSLGLASSYSLTRNLNVTAGVRYDNAAAQRISPLTDDRQDGQAVYLGTVFKF